MMPPARVRVCLIVLLALIAGVYAATLRSGHRWGDDFAMYLHHAANIANGVPYADTGYIYNPAVPSLGPHAYPPGLPILLAPVYKIAGLNLTAMKLILIAFSVLALGVLYHLLEDYLPPAWRLALIAMLAFQADALDTKDDIISEPPFLFFAFLSLLLLKNASSAVRGLAAGAAIAAACAFRNPGAALVATPAIFFVFSGGKRPKLSAAIAATVTGGLYWLLQSRALASTQFVGGMFKLSGARVYSNVLQFLAGGTLRQFWLNGFSNAASKGLYVVFVLLCIWGVIRVVRKGPGVIEAFCLAYALLLAFYDGIAYRIILPALPFLLTYALVALRDLTARLAPAPRRVAIACAALCVIATDAGAISARDWAPIREGIADEHFLQLCAELKQHPAAPVLFRKPRVLSLLTGRPAAAYTLSKDPEQNKRFLQSIGAGFVVRTSVTFENSDDDTLYLAPLLDKYPSAFAEIYRNARYRLYRVKF